MLRYGLAVAALVALAGPQPAFSQSPPAAAPSPAGPPPQAGGMHDHGVDRAAWLRRMCTERYAREGGRLGYLQARLDITDQQRDAWTKWRMAVMNAAAAERTACLADAAKADSQPTVLDREARAEQVLGAKLQALQESKPLLQALYAVLTPDQKTVLDHMHDGRHRRFADRGRAG